MECYCFELQPPRRTSFPAFFLIFLFYTELKSSYIQTGEQSFNVTERGESRKLPERTPGKFRLREQKKL